MLALAATLATATVAAADQQYAVSGSDVYQIGTHELATSVVYSGSQRLSVSRQGASTRYSARVDYTRADQSGNARGIALFSAAMDAAGEQRDQTDRDPNYLTVLNQPFSVQLDGPTLSDISHLNGRLPFDFPSLMTGGTLHGYLSRGSTGIVDGKRVIGVTFDATGTMRGPLPDRPAIALDGRMTMHGIAYYEIDNALLLALDATLRIAGTIDDAHKQTPVTIVYKRTIRANNSARQEALRSQ